MQALELCKSSYTTLLCSFFHTLDAGLPTIHTLLGLVCSRQKLKETKSLSDVEDKLLKLKGRKCYDSFLDERSCVRFGS